jgi:hypothetical protein
VSSFIVSALGFAESVARALEATAQIRKARYSRAERSFAIFAEVKIDEQLGVIRVTRVNAVAAGRILKTAHSQVMGSVVWGIGMALHEETLYDHRFGQIMNANIGGYHVPVNADVQDIKVIFVEEQDALINELGVKGLGENRNYWGRCGDRQCDLPRDRQAHPGSSDHDRQGRSVASSVGKIHLLLRQQLKLD